MTALAPIAPRLRKLLLMLSSSAPGEIVAAARAINQTLKGAGQDWHDLAERVEHANGGGLTDAEMKKLYNAGFDAGLRAAEDKHHGSDDFANIDGTPNWHRVARYCQRNNHKLETRHHKFIDDMASRTVWAREPTEKQQKYLFSLFYKLGRKLQ
jgi:hypothetical protein